MKIIKLQVFSAHIQEQYRFYRDRLGLEIIRYSENSFDVQLGYSILEFQYRKSAKPSHIAFHIPNHQEKKALQWIKERVPVLMYNRDEIIDFSAWNAKSLYFYDADKNILEFISRANFSKPESALFSEKSILGISEIGMGTKNIKEKFNFLNSKFGLKIYDGDFEKFCAIGNDEGLFICINTKLKDWFPANDKAYVADFSVEFIQKEKTHRLHFENDELKLVQHI